MNNIIDARQFIVWIKEYFLKEYKPEFFKYKDKYVDNVIVLDKEKNVTISFLITDNNELNIVIKNQDKEYCTLIDKNSEKYVSNLDLDTASIIVENKQYIEYGVNTILDYFNYYRDKEESESK